MVFELDTKDMERHAIELRLYMDKARRRFIKAQMSDMYEKIVKNQLPQVESAPNAIQIDQVSEEDTRRLSDFLDSLVDKCMRFEQHQLLQGALRKSLGVSRRKSVIDSQGQQIEPICFFCAGNMPQAESNLAALGSTNLYEAINLCVGHQNHQQAPLIQAGAETSFALVDRRANSPGLDPLPTSLMNGHGAAHPPTPPASNGAPTPQPPVVVGATSSEASTSDSQRSSHTPPYPPPPSPPPPVAGSSNASRANKRARLDLVEPPPSRTTAADNLEDSLSEWFSDPNNLQRASTPLSDNDDDTKEAKDNKIKPIASVSGSQVNVFGQALAKPAKETKGQRSNTSQVKINTQASTMASISKMSDCSSSIRKQAPIMKKRPKRSQPQTSSQDCSRYKQTNNSQSLNPNGRLGVGSGQGASSSFSFGLAVAAAAAAASNSSMSQPARLKQPELEKQPQPSPIVKCRPKSSKKSSIIQPQCW